MRPTVYIIGDNVTRMLELSRMRAIWLKFSRGKRTHPHLFVDSYQLWSPFFPSSLKTQLLGPPLPPSNWTHIRIKIASLISALISYQDKLVCLTIKKWNHFRSTFLRFSWLSRPNAMWDHPIYIFMAYLKQSHDRLSSLHLLSRTKPKTVEGYQLLWRRK